MSSYEAGQPYVYALYGGSPEANSWPQFRQNAGRAAAAVSQLPADYSVLPPGLAVASPFLALRRNAKIEASTNLITWISIGSVPLTSRRPSPIRMRPVSPPLLPGLTG